MKRQGRAVEKAVRCADFNVKRLRPGNRVIDVRTRQIGTVLAADDGKALVSFQAHQAGEHASLRLQYRREYYALPTNALVRKYKEYEPVKERIKRAARKAKEQGAMQQLTLELSNG